MLIRGLNDPFTGRETMAHCMIAPVAVGSNPCEESEASSHKEKVGEQKSLKYMHQVAF